MSGEKTVSFAKRKKYQETVRLSCPRCEGLGYLEISAEDIFYKKNKKASSFKCKKWRNELRKIGKPKLSKMTLREIGRLIGVSHPQTVKFHLQTIESDGWKNFE